MRAISAVPERRCWLIKSEPHVYSFQDLIDDVRTDWPGVRNYQARNYLRDEIWKGDLVLFYHSNARPSGVVGVARVVRAGYPDPTAFDPKDPYYDPNSDPAKPRWYMIDLVAERKLPRMVTLEEIKAEPALEGMALRTRSRLSVQPVSTEHFAHIVRMSQRPAAE